MKIVLATPLYPPEIGGPATYVKELAERLRDAHEVTIVAFASTSEKVPRTRLITVSKRRPLPLRLLKFTYELYKAAKDADVIYVQNAVAAGLPAVVVGWFCRIPVVIKFVGDEAWERATQLRKTHKPLEEFLAGMEGSFKIRAIRYLQGFVLRRANAVTTPSAYLAEAVRLFYRVPRERLTVNYNAAEKTESAPFDGVRVPHQVAVTARLVEWKGVAGVLHAVALLIKEFPDVKLVIAGDGPEEERLKQLACELGVEKKVEFRGRVSRAETWYLRQTSGVYVLNSIYEGLPHTVLTSFAAGIPVVATDIPGTNEAIYHEKTGLLVPPHDHRALAASIARLFKDRSLAERVSTGGRALLQEKFSWHTHLGVLLELLESVRPKPGN